MHELASELQSISERLSALADELVVPILGESLPIGPPPHVNRYCQNDPLWAREVYAGELTFAGAGCYTLCINYVAQYGGYDDTPIDTAYKLREAGAYVGADLSRPHNIPAAYPRLEWPAWAYWNRPGDRVDDSVMMFIRGIIKEQGFLILKVDYKPENYKYNMHFILGCGVDRDSHIHILDPLTGKVSALLSSYGATRGWGEAQAIFGYRGLRLK